MYISSVPAGPGPQPVTDIFASPWSLALTLSASVVIAAVYVAVAAWASARHSRRPALVSTIIYRSMMIVVIPILATFGSLVMTMFDAHERYLEARESWTTTMIHWANAEYGVEMTRSAARALLDQDGRHASGRVDGRSVSIEYGVVNNRSVLVIDGRPAEMVLGTHER